MNKSNRRKTGGQPKIDSPEFIRQQITTYFQELSLAAVSKKLYRRKDRIRENLKKKGIQFYDSSTSAKIKKHSKGKFWRPIPKKLLETLNGELLGDSHIRCDTDPLGTKWIISLSHYRNALSVMQHLRTVQLASEAEAAIAIEKFNNSRKILSEAQLGQICYVKSFLEEPLLWFLAELFRSSGYSVTIKPAKDNAHIALKTQYSVNLYWLRQLCYPHGIRGLRHINSITPRVLFHLFIGDGNRSIDCVSLNTHSFTYSENKLLADLLQDTIGINVTVQPDRPSKAGDMLYYLNITHSRNINAFFDYLESDPSLKDALDLTKALFPWKFSKLRKKDFYDKDNEFVDEEYLRTFLDLLKKSGVDISERKAQLHYRFPWIFPPSDRL